MACEGGVKRNYVDTTLPHHRLRQVVVPDHCLVFLWQHVRLYSCLHSGGSAGW